MLFDRAVLRLFNKAPQIITVIVAVVTSATLMLCWKFKLVEGQVTFSIWIAAAVCSAIFAAIIKYCEQSGREIATKLSEEDEP